MIPTTNPTVKPIKAISVDWLAIKYPAVAAPPRIAKASKMNVIASGGVTTIDDVKKIAKLEKYGVTGAIVGKALYTEDFKLEEAIRALNKK